MPMGNVAPFFRASDRPMAIAWFRLFTVFPLRPDLSVPLFRRRIALWTRLAAVLPYFRRPEDFRPRRSPSSVLELLRHFWSGWRVLCQRIDASMELLHSSQFVLT
jgi:hypothetical protein